jgi:hypothetical protein
VIVAGRKLHAEDIEATIHEMADDRLRHEGQIGTGGCTRRPQSWQPWMRSVPSSPAVQNQYVQGVFSGSGLMRPTMPRPAGGRRRSGCPAAPRTRPPPR